MSYFKRFTDFCAGFAIFSALIYMLGEFMTFNPKDVQGMTDKVKAFLDRELQSDNRAYVFMIILFGVSLIAGRVFERMPYISFAVSLLPLGWVCLMLWKELLSERPMLYLIMAAVHCLGNLVHSLYLDRDDEKRRAFLCVNILGGAVFAGGAFLYYKATSLLKLSVSDTKELAIYGEAILKGARNGEHKLILTLSLIVLATVVISILLRDIYFIDAICALPILVYSIYIIAAEKLTVAAQAVLVFVFLYFAFRIALLLFEPMAKGEHPIFGIVKKFKKI